MDDCGAILHNIETKWLYDFLTLEKCRNFSQAAVSRNVSQPAFSRRIRALEQGEIECPEIPHAQTLHMMEVMDALRQSWGMVYPFD